MTRNGRNHPATELTSAPFNIFKMYLPASGCSLDVLIDIFMTPSIAFAIVYLFKLAIGIYRSLSPMQKELFWTKCNAT